MPTNEFLPFGESATGADILSQPAYAIDPQRTIGKQIGLARRALDNKALRQSTAIASALAQLTVDRAGVDMLDNANQTAQKVALAAGIDWNLDPVNHAEAAANTLDGTETWSFKKAGVWARAKLANISTYVVSIFTVAIRGGTGAIARTVLAALKSGPVYAEDFGAKFDGATDDYPALSNAIAYLKTLGGGTLKCPLGVSVCSGLFLIDFPLILIGDGDGNAAWTGFSASTGTEFKYTGPVTSGKFFEWRSINGGGWGCKRVKINANAKAATAALVDSCVYGVWEQVYVTGGTTRSLQLLGTYQTCSWNNFKNLRIDGTGSDAGLRLSGFVGQGNACHNTFDNLAVNFSGSSHGIVLAGCDNNTFVMTYEYAAPGATGYGVYVDPTEQTNFPLNNAFYHLEASTRGWYQPNTTALSPAAIYGYMQDNGQPWPVTNGTYLVVYGGDRGSIQIPQGGSFGRSKGNNLFGASFIATGNNSVAVTLPNGADPDTNYSVFVQFTNNPTSGGHCVRNRTTTQFEVAIPAAAPVNLFFEFLIVRV